MEVLEIDGRRFVKASKAARTAGYTTDYVGQLCRGNKITAHLVGRSWYVDVDELRTHKVDTKRSSRIKAREQVRKAIAQKTEAPASAEKQYEKRLETRHISYEQDETGLIPEVRKLSIESEQTVDIKEVLKEQQKQDEKIPSYTVEREGEKIVMSGKLTVVDATDEFMLDADAVRLHPEIQKGIPDEMRTNIPAAPKKEEQKVKKLTAVSAELGSKKQNVVIPEPAAPAFEERLSKYKTDDSNEISIQNLDISDNTNTADLDAKVDVLQKTQRAKSSVSRIPVTSIGFAIGIAVMLLLVLLEGQWVYTTSDDDGEMSVNSGLIESEYRVNPGALFAKIPFKI